MNIYLAGPWVHRGDMLGIASSIESLGHSITWKWWETEEVKEGTGRDDFLKGQALSDLNGVRSADLVVVINSAKSEGKSFEQGVAIALGKPIIIVGNRGTVSANVFHYLPQFRWVETIDGMLETLKTISWLVDGGHNASGSD